MARLKLMHAVQATRHSCAVFFDCGWAYDAVRQAVTGRGSWRLPVRLVGSSSASRNPVEGLPANRREVGRASCDLILDGNSANRIEEVATVVWNQHFVTVLRKIELNTVCFRQRSHISISGRNWSHTKLIECRD